MYMYWFCGKMFWMHSLLWIAFFKGILMKWINHEHKMNYGEIYLTIQNSFWAPIEYCYKKGLVFHTLLMWLTLPSVPFIILSVLHKTFAISTTRLLIQFSIFIMSIPRGSGLAEFMGCIDNKRWLVAHKKQILDFPFLPKATQKTPRRWSFAQYRHYRQTSNISRNLVGNKSVDHPDVIGASPVGAAPTTSSFST